MPAALLRPPTVRRLAELLRHLPVPERTTILAQAVCEGSMTRAGADQVLIAIAMGQSGQALDQPRGSHRDYLRDPFTSDSWSKLGQDAERLAHRR